VQESPVTYAEPATIPPATGVALGRKFVSHDRNVAIGMLASDRSAARSLPRMQSCRQMVMTIDRRRAGCR
jgi:hypothetical protein